ncbi:MAG: hypothetical protein ACI94Z_001228 [Yoonia sp.]
MIYLVSSRIPIFLTQRLSSKSWGVQSNRRKKTLGLRSPLANLSQVFRLLIGPLVQKYMINILIKHAILTGSTLLSLLFLGFFLYMQSKGSVILKLEAQWVAISILPILIALVVGGYIAKFKGFGIELEGKLEAPVNSIQLKATDAIEEFPGNEKESMPDLFRVSETHRFAAKRLSFNLDKKNYYGLHAIEEYISALPNIEYFEVKRANGEFVCLLRS